MIKIKIAQAISAHILSRICFLSAIVSLTSLCGYLNTWGGSSATIWQDTVITNMYYFANGVSIIAALAFLVVMFGMLFYEVVKVIEIIDLGSKNKNNKGKELKSLEKLHKAGYISKEELDEARKKVVNQLVEKKG